MQMPAEHTNMINCIVNDFHAHLKFIKMAGFAGTGRSALGRACPHTNAKALQNEKRRLSNSQHRARADTTSDLPTNHGTATTPQRCRSSPEKSRTSSSSCVCSTPTYVNPCRTGHHEANMECDGRKWTPRRRMRGERRRNEEYGIVC